MNQLWLRDTVTFQRIHRLFLKGLGLELRSDFHTSGEGVGRLSSGGWWWAGGRDGVEFLKN